MAEAAIQAVITAVAVVLVAALAEAADIMAVEDITAEVQAVIPDWVASSVLGSK